MFEAGFTCILSKSLMNTRTKTEQKLSLFLLFFQGIRVSSLAEFISENSSFIIIAFIVISVLAFVVAGIKYKKEHPDGIDAEIDEMFVKPETMTESFRVTVVDMVCYADMTGTKSPKSKRVFTVSFETESGEILKKNVTEEMYDGFDKGQTGVLTLVDGDLYSFEIK